MNKIRWFFNNFEEICGALLLLFMACLAFLNVLTRYFIKYSFAPTEELEVASMVYLTMLGASAGFKRGLHLKLIFFEKRLSEKYKKFLNLFSNILSFCLFCSILFLSYFHIKDEIELQITTEALNIPEWIYIIAIPFGCLLINIRILQNIHKLIKKT